MFDSLSERLNAVLDRLTRRGALSEADVDVALQEVQRALIEADVALLHRSRLRPFRRRAFFRPRRRAAARPAGFAALDGRSLLARHADAMAGLGAVAFCRSPAGARRRHRLARVLCRPRKLARSDRRSQYAARPGMVGARVAFPFRRAETRERSGHRLCRPAADRRRSGVARALRSSRCRDIVAARRRASPARHHAARQ